MSKQKKVYVGMAVDVFHPGHLNIINVAKELGEVTIGLLTDQAIAQYKRTPLLDFEQRKMILESIKGVKTIIPQETFNYEPNLRKVRPDYVVHGDDWKSGILKESREKVIKVISEWGGKLIEPKYTENISSTQLINQLRDQGVTPDNRLRSLRRVMDIKPQLRIIEAHNGLTGLIGEKTSIDKGDEKREFDGLWLSSLTLSTALGKPDTEVVDFSKRFQIIEEIIEVTTKPIIVDGDTGGQVEHFKFRVRTLERLGVSAIVIEDKVGNKRNSLFGTDVVQEQETIENFCNKIREGNRALITSDFMIIARIESLILNQGMDDALARAKAYIDAGANGIMIHSKNSDGKEIVEFCNAYKSFINRVPLVVVPSTFSHFTEQELKDLGVSIVIYGNHLIRGAYPAMIKVAESILENGRSKEASDKYCMSIKDIITLIPEDY